MHRLNLPSFCNRKAVLARSLAPSSRVFLFYFFISFFGGWNYTTYLLVTVSLSVKDRQRLVHWLKLCCTFYFFIFYVYVYRTLFFFLSFFPFLSFFLNLRKRSTYGKHFQPLSGIFGILIWRRTPWEVLCDRITGFRWVLSALLSKSDEGRVFVRCN